MKTAIAVLLMMGAMCGWGQSTLPRGTPVYNPICESGYRLAQNGRCLPIVTGGCPDDNCFGTPILPPNGDWIGTSPAMRAAQQSNPWRGPSVKTDAAIEYVITWQFPDGSRGYLKCDTVEGKQKNCVLTNASLDDVANAVMDNVNEHRDSATQTHSDEICLLAEIAKLKRELAAAKKKNAERVYICAPGDKCVPQTGKGSM
jgi:hypothetical protein